MPTVYEIITDRIIKLLEQGAVPWHKPWKSGGEPKNLHSGKPYRGVNVLLLSSAGYESPWWISFKQAQQRGGRVKKGEHGYPCVFWLFSEKTDQKTGKTKKIATLRYYTIFNVEQTEGLEYPTSSPAREHKPLELCERVIQGYPNPPRIEHKGDKAFYSPPQDLVGVPKPEAFDSAEDFYSTTFHELSHSTGHCSRLSRPGIMEKSLFASNDYSKEELIAEMGASFLAGHCGIESKLLDNSASYISSWMQNLKDDSRIIIHSSSSAQKSTDYILN